MTDTLLTADDERVIERAARLHLYYTLASPLEPRSPRVLPSMISDYVDGTHPDTDGAIVEALRTKLPLRRLYSHLRDRRSRAMEIEQVAAAGGVSLGTQLVLDHVTLYWREVIPNSSRYVLRLVFHEGAHPAPNARPVLHLEWETSVDRIVFPEIVDGATQCVLSADDPRLERLMTDAGRTQPSTRYRVVA